MLSIRSISCLALFCSLCANAQHGWDSNAYLPGLGRDDAVCFTLDEIIFIGTGNHGGFWESNTFYALNTRTGMFEDVASFPGEPRQYTRAEEIGFKAYLIGGIDENLVPLDEVWEYDLINDSWTQKKDFPGGARWKAASFVLDNKIYYGTGTNGSISYNDWWKYDPENDQWQQVQDIPVLPRNETIGFSLYGDGFIGLGMDCTGVMQQDIWRYDAFSNSWSYETDFPPGPRWYAVSEVLNGFAYVGTGEDQNAIMYNDFWKYHPGTKVWEQAENLPNPPRRGTAACAIPYKGIFIACGLDDNFQRLTDISRYTNRALNPPELKVFYNVQEQKVYVHDLPYYAYVRVVDLQGRKLFETNERIDNVGVDVSDWSPGIYVVWVGSKSAKFMLW